MMIHHFFLPHKHKKKHRKAHLLSHKALGVYVIFFIFMQLGFSVLRSAQPGVLGTTSAITREEVIALTNIQREKYGQPSLKENTILDKAAEDKAKNMFAENYWAHFSPSGKSPWVWFKQEGYNYIYAGENLARGYSTSKDTMDAWMASKMGHKENVLGSNYKEIGIAVEDGVLNGEKTTLVVQLFGSPQSGIAEVSNDGAKTVDDNKIATSIPSTENTIPDQEVNSAKTETVQQASFLSQLVQINPYSLTRTVSISLIGFLLALGLLDFFVMWKRGSLVKLHLRHYPHTTLITGLLIFMLLMQAGKII